MFTFPHAAALAPCHRPAASMEEPTELEESTEHEYALTDPAIDRNQSLDRLIQTKQISHVDLLNTELLDPEYEGGFLETMDSCVGCVEGVDEQHVYEEKLHKNALHRKAAVEQHGLSEAEAAMIRLHIMEEGRDDSNRHGQVESAIPDLDILNLCGADNDLHDAQESFLIPASQEILSCADIINEDLILSPKRDVEVRDGIVLGQGINALQCAICFDEALTGESISLNRVKFANLPCCGGQQNGSTASFIKVCTSCILVLTTKSSKGVHRVGRCPRCFEWIKVHLPEASQKNVVRVEKVDAAGPCLICNQNKDVLVEDDNICDACFLGRRQPLKYECQQCHEVQKIPHPMYRYQESEDKFGTVTWACQGKCGRFTKWKIQLEEIQRIPLGDAPKSWESDYISLARKRVRILRQDLVGFTSLEHDPSQCVIM